MRHHCNSTVPNIPVRTIVSAVTAVVVALTAPPASAASEREQHCVVVAHSIAELDQTEADISATAEEPVCFATIEEAADYVPVGRGEDAVLASTTIGWHFTGLNYSGSSVRITGTTCGGGLWYASGSWNNNIESSHHYCGTAPTRFWANSNCTGDVRNIFSSTSTLHEMNNRTSCVQYG